MRTKKSPSPTKEKLLDAAQRLMLTNGCVGTSVDEICRAAKVTKGSFFHYFESKDQLCVELLKRYCADAKESFHAGCCGGEKDPLKRVYGFLDALIARARGVAEAGGCLLGSMAQELSDSHPEIRAICAKGFEEMADVLKQDLRAAKSLHMPKRAIDAESLANHFVAVLEGTMIVAKVRRNGHTMEKGLRHYKQYLQALFGR